MNFALLYLPERAAYRVWSFLHHWYWDGSRYLLNVFIAGLERLDRGLALKITLRHFFEPLYGDYTVIGRILGLVFRSLRATLGICVYGVCALLFLPILLLWVGAPLIFLIHAILSFF